MSIYYPEAVTLVPDGVTETFTLPSLPASAGSFLLLWNGQVQRDSYTLVSTTLTTNFGQPVPSSDSLVAYYTTQAPLPTPVSGGASGFNPEQIANALFILLGQANFPFASMDRRGKIWGNVPPANQPYLALIESGAGIVQSQTWALEKWTLRFTVLIYIRADATASAIPATSINAALQAIVEVMRNVPPDMPQTLGGLAVSAWIEGEVMIDTGILDEQCALIIPIKVLTGR